jgi:dihydroxy-acid dehydratase
MAKGKTTGKGKSLERNWSRAVTDGAERAASRAMLHAVGFSREDFAKSQIGKGVSPIIYKSEKKGSVL